VNPRAVLRDLLKLAAEWQIAAFAKAKPPEPDAAEKLRAERKLAAVVGAYFARLAKKATAKLKADPPAQKATRIDDFDDEFFDDDDFFADLLAILIAAQQLGALSLPAMLSLDLDLNATNKEAEQAAKTYAYDLIKDLTDTSRETLRDAISDFVKTPGMTIGDVIDRLPFSEQRAALIATTEITRAYATGQAAAGESLKEQFPDVRVVKTWYTNVDDRVCPICGPLHLVSVDMDEEFDNEFDGPPAHPGCRCSITYGTRL
jgi:hypothetical protein